jgi:hypothetical protein
MTEIISFASWIISGMVAERAIEFFSVGGRAEVGNCRKIA